MSPIAYAAVSPVLDERSRRRWAAAESVAIGYGGDALVSSATGLARETIRKGRRKSRKAGRRQVAYDARARGDPVSNRGSLASWPPWKGWWIR